jgi:hypothetical protein
MLSAQTGSAMVVIIDDDSPGCIRFQKEEVEVEEDVEEKSFDIGVERIGGASGKVEFSYRTENMTATAGVDYEEAKGTLALEQGVQIGSIPVTIKAKGRYATQASFNLVIEDIEGPPGCRFDKDTDGGSECCICHITIKGNVQEERMALLQKIESRIMSNRGHLGARNWRQQFSDALFKVGDDDDDEDGGDETKEGKKKGGRRFGRPVHLGLRRARRVVAVEDTVRVGSASGLLWWLGLLRRCLGHDSCRHGDCRRHGELGRLLYEH